MELSKCRRQVAGIKTLDFIAVANVTSGIMGYLYSSETKYTCDNIDTWCTRGGESSMLSRRNVNNVRRQSVSGVCVAVLTSDRARSSNGCYPRDLCNLYNPCVH